jgi:hypothetical protein
VASSGRHLLWIAGVALAVEVILLLISVSDTLF